MALGLVNRRYDDYLRADLNERRFLQLNPKIPLKDRFSQDALQSKRDKTFSTVTYRTCKTAQEYVYPTAVSQWLQPEPHVPLRACLRALSTSGWLPAMTLPWP